jgi:hypothetical protein
MSLFFSSSLTREEQGKGHCDRLPNPTPPCLTQSVTGTRRFNRVAAGAFSYRAPDARALETRGALRVRHAGHADILREQLDGAAKIATDNPNLPRHDTAWWENYRARVEQTAKEFWFNV